MAYNNGMPMGYIPYGYAQQPMQPQTIQNGGVVNVQSEKEARDYLVAQGTSVTFINGNDKKVYVKTKGFSSLDVPTFETYNLVKDEFAEETSVDMPFVKKDEFEALRKDFAAFKERMSESNAKSNANATNAESV